MLKVKFMDLSEKQKFIDKNQKHKKKNGKTIKIKDSPFEIGLRKDLIKKNEDGYYNLVGDYGELLAFKNNSSSQLFEWLD